jgi:hypothetical protein
VQVPGYFRQAVYVILNLELRLAKLFDSAKTVVAKYFTIIVQNPEKNIKLTSIKNFMRHLALCFGRELLKDTIIQNVVLLF